MSTESFNTPAVTFTAPAQGETTAPEVVTQGASAEQEAPEQEPRTFTQEELDAAIGKRIATERRRWDREQAQARENPQPATSEVPKRENFKDDASFLEALVDHKAEQKIAQREQQKRQTEVDSTHDERMASASDKYDDFDEKMRAPGWYCSPVAFDAIKESELGPDIAYYLATNPQESKRIFDLGPVSQVREIGKIEAKLVANPPAKKTSSAPAPINPVGSRTQTGKYSPSDPRSVKQTSDSEWIEARRAELAKKRQ